MKFRTQAKLFYFHLEPCQPKKKKTQKISKAPLYKLFHIIKRSFCLFLVVFMKRKVVDKTKTAHSTIVHPPLYHLASHRMPSSDTAGCPGSGMLALILMSPFHFG